LTEFGPNGVVLNHDERTARGYVSVEKPRIRRVLLACFLCGIAASVSVALIAVLIAFVSSTISAAFGVTLSLETNDGGLLAGAIIAVMMAAFNWYLFYIIVPITWLVLAFSLGRFPRRGVVRHMPYYRWGGIWGALLVGGTTGLFGAMMNNGSGLGALLTGIIIGGLAGVLCASLFLAIVRPKKQVGMPETDVF